MTKGKTWNGSAIYEIKAAGRLGEQWTDWFGGLWVECEGEMTLISGEIRDQAALHGLLAKIRDIGMPIVSVRRLDTDSDQHHVPGGSNL